MYRRPQASLPTTASSTSWATRTARPATPSWRAFATDPEWTNVYTASQRNGSLTSKIESVFLTTTDYSPKLNMSSGVNARLFELRTYTTNPGKLENLHSRFRDHTLRIFTKHGMSNFLYWRPTGGQPGWENRMVYLLDLPQRGCAQLRMGRLQRRSGMAEGRRRQPEGRNHSRLAGRRRLCATCPDRLFAPQLGAEGITLLDSASRAAFHRDAALRFQGPLNLVANATI